MSKKERELLFSVTLKDCKVDTFRAGGPGGQNQNKRDSAARVTHEPSGAVGESREHKSQLQNKKAAFQRMASTKVFMQWAMQKASDQLSQKDLEAQIREAMRPENLRVEVVKDDKWTEETSADNELRS